LVLFEAVVNAIHRAARLAANAFNTRVVRKNKLHFENQHNTGNAQ
jgi:hypothetical protein